jgi:hypothetical protein
MSTRAQQPPATQETASASNSTPIIKLTHSTITAPAQEAAQVAAICFRLQLAGDETKVYEEIT